MASTEQKRQKKLAKKRSKQIAKQKQIAAEKNALKSVPGQIASASKSDALTCYIHGDSDSGGMYSVIVTRPLPNGHLFSAFFLVDGDCLGIKDCFGRLASPAEMAKRLDHLRRESRLSKCEPAFAKKLVVDAAQWASQHGFTPCGDYDRVREIWRDVDETRCEERFAFGGEDGKPVYVQGPNDSDEFVEYVLRTLKSHAGQGNFDFILAMQQPEDRDALESAADVGPPRLS